MKRDIEAAIQKAARELFAADAAIELTRPEEQFGDYATSIALQLAGKLGKKPREIAQQLADALQNLPYIAEVSIAGPGFINLRLSDEALVALAESEAPKTLTGKKFIVEYSDPNPFKPLHAGHLYTTLVGDTIARLVQRLKGVWIRIFYDELFACERLWRFTLGQRHQGFIAQAQVNKPWPRY
jgi:arginyl-tRNA synthetase